MVGHRGAERVRRPPSLFTCKSVQRPTYYIETEHRAQLARNIANKLRLRFISLGREIEKGECTELPKSQCHLFSCRHTQLIDHAQIPKVKATPLRGAGKRKECALLLTPFLASSRALRRAGRDSFLCHRGALVHRRRTRLSLALATRCVLCISY